MNTRKRTTIAVAAMVMGCLLPHWTAAQSGGDPEILGFLSKGTEAMQAGDFEAAIVQYEQGIALDSDGTTTGLYFGMGEALRYLESYQDALKFYTRAQQADGKFAPTYNGRGICLRELGQMDVALNDFRNAVELGRNNPDFAANLGDLLVNTFGQYPSALQQLDRAIELFGESTSDEVAKAYRNRGWAHASLRSSI